MLDSHVVWSAGRWERRDYATIMSGRVVRYNVKYGLPGEAEVSASRDGVNIDGVVMGGEHHRLELLDILRRAWRQHEHLKQAHQNDPIPED
jgi:hypothetical protein